MADLCHKLLLDLLAVCERAQRQGCDRPIADRRSQARAQTDSEPIAAHDDSAANEPAGDPRALVQSLKSGLRRESSNTPTTMIPTKPPPS